MKVLRRKIIVGHFFIEKLLDVRAIFAKFELNIVLNNMKPMLQ